MDCIDPARMRGLMAPFHGVRRHQSAGAGSISAQYSEPRCTGPHGWVRLLRIKSNKPAVAGEASDIGRIPVANLKLKRRFHVVNARAS